MSRRFAAVILVVLVAAAARADDVNGFVEVTARPHVPDITFVFSGRRAA